MPRAECLRKARKGLIRVETVVGEDGFLEDIVISGDFFVYPEDALIGLESMLRGLGDERQIEGRVREYLDKYVDFMPGVSVDDFVNTILCAYREARQKS